MLSLNNVYAKNDQKLQKGHMIGAKLFAENEEAHRFSFNYLNVVPMYRAFNYPFFHHKVERPFLKFAQEVTGAGDSVCLIVSASPNTRYDEQTRQCINIPTRDWPCLRNNGLAINIPQSVSVIAFSLSERGGVRQVFAFVGNNDDSSRKHCFPHDMSALQNCYSRDGDPTSIQIIEHLKSAGYNMWSGHVIMIHRRIPRPIYRSTVDRLSVEYQQQLDCRYIGQYIGPLSTKYYWSTQQQQQIDGPILPPIHRSIDDRWTVDGLSVEYQQQLDCPYISQYIGPLSTEYYWSIQQQQQIDGSILPPIHRSIDDRWTVDGLSVEYQQQLDCPYISQYIGPLSTEYYWSTQQQQQQIDGSILPPIHRSIDDRWTVDGLSVEYQQQLDCPYISQYIGPLSTEYYWSTQQQQQQIDGSILPPIHRSIDDRWTVDGLSVEYQQQLDCPYISQYIGPLSTEYYWSTQPQQQIDGSILPPIHRSIDDRWTVDGLSVEYQQQLDCPYISQYTGPLSTEYYCSTQQQQQIDGSILPPIHRSIDDRWTVDGLSVEYQQQLDCPYISQYIGPLSTEYYWSTQQQQQIDGSILPPIHRSIDDRWTVDGLSVEYQQQLDCPYISQYIGPLSTEYYWSTQQQQQIDGSILPPIHRSIDDRWTVDGLSVEYQQQLDCPYISQYIGPLSTEYYWSTQQQQQIDGSILPPIHRSMTIGGLSTDYRSNINNN